jgi:quercetin dioxygenase-like cupin family protein
MRLAIAAVIAAACGHPDARARQPSSQPSSQPLAQPAPEPAVAPVAPEPRQPSPTADPNADQQVRLAAIQKAMNDLTPAMQACWASVAVERFDIFGELQAFVEIEKTGAKVTFTSDSAHHPKLAACVAQVLAKYPWAPPLYGQAIKLPFRFHSQDGQNAIDRALVPWNGQDKVAVAVLLDEANSNNAAASMFELAIAGGGTTELRASQRAELWYFLGPGEVRIGTAKRTVAAGDMMYVPTAGGREVAATAGDLHAMIVAVPGGREGAARAGALPTPTMQVKSGYVGPVFLPAKDAKSYPRGGGSVAIFAEPATIKDKTLAASILELPAGAAIPEHVHAKESELLYMLAGNGTLTVKGVAQPVTATSVVQIPPDTKHAFTATTAVRAVQIYTPAGPEQRFKAKP